MKNINKYIAVLMTCHNRMLKTLECLTALYNATLPKNHIIDVFLVDDGCIDGTPLAVKKKFPEVDIVRGTGHLYWNQGMRLAWQSAAKKKDYDFYLWLNDDTYVYLDSLKELLSCASKSNDQSIICGTCISKLSSEITYGGYDKDYKIIIPNGNLNLCYLMNGNLTLVPKYVFENLGYLSNSYRHALGDFDYCIRATKKKIKVYTARRVVGHCEANTKTLQCYNFEIPLLKRIKILYSPLGLNPFEFFIFDKLQNGYFVAIKHFFYNHIKLFLNLKL